MKNMMAKKIITACEVIHKERTKIVPYQFKTGKFCLGVIAVIAAGILILAAPNIIAQTVQPLAVPAEFVRDLTPPGSQNNFVRPSRIISDRQFDEIYVADPGNNRITIFDKKGTFKFAFPVGAQCGAPVDLAVNSKGTIFVLGSTAEGRQVMTYDYDGLYLGRFLTSGDSSLVGLDIQSLAIDAGDRIYLFDLSRFRIIRFSADGEYEIQIPVIADMNENERLELTFGSLSLSSDGTIYLPLASVGTVLRFDPSGQKLNSLGYKGNDLSELNFPISVAVTSDGIVMVLDKHRYNVVCYSQNGRFLGEFGGKGINPGWFYHPTWLAVDSDDQVYIGQIFMNKVQVCRIPDFIRDRQKQIAGNWSDHQASSPMDVGSTSEYMKKMSALHGCYSCFMQVPTFTSIKLQVVPAEYSLTISSMEV